jgi:hypothetical protein
MLLVKPPGGNRAPISVLRCTQKSEPTSLPTALEPLTSACTGECFVTLRPAPK